MAHEPLKWYDDQPDHPPWIRALADARRLATLEGYPNTVQPLESRLAERHYTCGMYVFQFCEDEDYIEIARLGLPDVHAGVAFFEWLLANHLLEVIDETDARDGDLIMYFDNGHWKHVGISKAIGRVESKWGLGLLHNHGRWEVPKNYGDEIRFFRSISPDEAIEHFVQYAESRGVFFRRVRRERLISAAKTAVRASSTSLVSRAF